METFYPGCMAIVRLECTFFIWETQLSQKQCIISHQHGLWYDHDVVLGDIASVKFNNNNNKCQEKTPSILSIRMSSKYGVPAMEVTELWSVYLISKLRYIYCSADMNFLEGVIDLLLNFSFSFFSLTQHDL